MALPAAMALSGLNEESFSADGLCDIFHHGAILLKSLSTSSIASSVASAETVSSHESGISSMSSEGSLVKNLAPYFELLYESNVQLQPVDNEDLASVCSSISSPEPPRIIYGNRDILEFESNTSWQGWNFQPAELRSGVQFFFQNRSQYWRVLEAPIPKHKTFYCSFYDCLFGDVVYAD